MLTTEWKISVDRDSDNSNVDGKEIIISVNNLSNKATITIDGRELTVKLDEFSTLCWSIINRNGHNE